MLTLYTFTFSIAVACMSGSKRMVNGLHGGRCLIQLTSHKMFHNTRTASLSYLPNGAENKYDISNTRGVQTMYGRNDGYSIALSEKHPFHWCGLCSQQLHNTDIPWRGGNHQKECLAVQSFNRVHFSFPACSSPAVK